MSSAPSDGRYQFQRCGWAATELDCDYHDREWGVPVYDDRLLFEFLILEGAQAGLSWQTILRKRANYRAAFEDFDPHVVAQYDQQKINELLTNPGIVRNRLKIDAAVRNAQAFLAVQREFGSFDAYVWRFVGGQPRKNAWRTSAEVPARTAESDVLSKDLKRRGFTFVGSTICYAFMQAVGMVNDHLVDCFRHAEVTAKIPSPLVGEGHPHPHPPPQGGGKALGAQAAAIPPPVSLMGEDEDEEEFRSRGVVTRTGGMVVTRRVVSYVSGVSDTPLLGLTIGDMFDQIVAQYAEHEALIVRHQGVRLTYRLLQEAVDRCARGLMALGLQKGERIGIWAPNRVEWTITQFATSKIGATLVNINPSYRAHELAYALEQSGCAVMVIAPRFRTSDYSEMLYALIPELRDSQPGHLRETKLPELRTVIRMGEERAPGMHTWGDVMAMAEQVTPQALAERQRQQQFDDPINIQYTSGTTGYPKGATLSHHGILNNAYSVARLMRFTHQDRLVIPVPLYHCFGMVMGNLACMTHGATMIYPSDGFDAQAVLEAVQEERATALYGVPTMFIAELEHPAFATYGLSSLRTGVMAGSPCPVEVMKKVNTLMHMREVEICYGMTEVSPVSTQTRADAPFDKRVSTVGQVHPHLEIKIIDPATGIVVPVDTPGELCSRGYSVMLGYWNNEEATRQAIDAGRWMHSGDLEVMDEEGYINIVGRIKDMIIRGGENVYPREIEEFLYTHPKVSDVQVIGVPDAKYGEEIMAWVRLREGEAADAEELREYCREKIAHYKIPRYVKFVDAFPTTVTGKVQKFIMRQESIKELGLEAAAGVEMA